MQTLRIESCPSRLPKAPSGRGIRPEERGVEVASLDDAAQVEERPRAHQEKKWWQEPIRLRQSQRRLQAIVNHEHGRRRQGANGAPD